MPKPTMKHRTSWRSNRHILASRSTYTRYSDYWIEEIVTGKAYPVSNFRLFLGSLSAYNPNIYEWVRWYIKTFVFLKQTVRKILLRMSRVITDFFACLSRKPMKTYCVKCHQKMFANGCCLQRRFFRTKQVNVRFSFSLWMLPNFRPDL